MTNSIAAVSVAFERVTQICDADTVIREHAGTIDAPSFRGEITFENVTFGYDPATPVLRDVSFAIKPGQTVGIVGQTGSGKSTVVSLIPRFRDLDAGSIRIDGVDIRDYKLRELRGQIGFVLQDTVLLRGTVRDNIAFGRQNATDDEIVEAAKMANAHGFISRMRDGYDSQIGDRGMTLSGGQATNRHRPCPDSQQSDTHPRRADRGAGHRVRTPRHRGPPTTHEGPHRHNDCPPSEHPA